MDFFISHNPQDAEWADWIDWQLQDAQQRVFHPGTDIHAGNNRVVEINKALAYAGPENPNLRVILILSQNYVGKSLEETAWTSVVLRDSDGSKGLLIPVIVHSDAHIPELLHAYKRIDLSGIKADNEAEAVRLLRTCIQAERRKIPRKPSFPGGKPKYPSTSATPLIPARGSEHPQRPSQTNASDGWIELIGRVDKTDQARHVVKQIPHEQGCLPMGRTWGFVLSGWRGEWPMALCYTLEHKIRARIKGEDQPPKVVPLVKEGCDKADSPPRQFLWKLLSAKLSCEPSPDAIVAGLQGRKICHIFYRELLSEEESDKAFLVEILQAWHELRSHLPADAPSQFLLLIRDTAQPEKPSRFRFPFIKPRLTWRQHMQNLLVAELGSALLPELKSPSWEDVSDWLKTHVNDDSSLRNALEAELANHFDKSQSAIPHGDLKKILLPLLQSHPTR